MGRSLAPAPLELSRRTISTTTACVLLIVWAAVLYLWAALVNMPSSPRPLCVPASAVDYRGDLDAWVDADSHIVLYASEEDQYEWCDQHQGA